MADPPSSPWSIRLKTLIFGLATAALYLLLFSHEEQVLTMSQAGRWNFLLPIAVAFIISYAHGSFTSAFWEMLGVRAKSEAPKEKSAE
ncbi:MAG: hypothetical protein HQL51_09655 [Magnetococcales bacterium]|nr:hypothetical protein [Magnetococcales bacterium]